MMLSRIQLCSRTVAGKSATSALLSHRQRISVPFVRLMSTGMSLNPLLWVGWKEG